MCTVEIKVGDTLQAVADINSYLKGRKSYAKRGDNLKVITVEHWPVLIVADSAGSKFSAHKNECNKIEYEKM